MGLDDTVRTVTRELKCSLSDQERLRLGDQLVSNESEHAQLQEAKAKLSADQRPLKKKSKELITKLKDGTELRTIECEKHLLYSSKEVFYVRTDTGEKFDRRTMTAEELQGDFFAEAGAAVEEGRKAKKGGKGSKAAHDDESDADNVVPFGAGRATTKKAARKPAGGKGRKR